MCGDVCRCASSDFDFRRPAHDGSRRRAGAITYKDVGALLRPGRGYVGICGQAEGLSHLPDSKFQPPMPLTCQETQLRNRARQKLGWTVTPARSANLTRPAEGASGLPLLRTVARRGCQSAFVL